MVIALSRYVSVAVGARLVFVVTFGVTDALPLYELIHFCLVVFTEIAVYCGSPVKTCVWDLTKTYITFCNIVTNLFLIYLAQGDQTV